MVNQKNIDIGGDGNKIVGGNDNSTTNNITIQPSGKLSSLFSKLKEQFEEGEKISNISNDLIRYTSDRDIIGLEEKLKLAQKQHLFEDFSWLKQEFHKKLLLYQEYAPAQEIFAFILAIVLDRYRNIIRPMLQSGSSESDVLRSISQEVTRPILDLIHQEGCDDIIGISSTEIEGMFHYLTGTCHIKWAV
ncbi:ABC-three component system protein [Marinoscillum sp. 108]|uniref:ABC-three component system protein n=1 Tax=Marinoscillum sp. 108 TaxID=2653151 RepID=UPI0012EF4BA8|nr:ABC-three component system protein [Marinoscillum sp. 108]VXD11632.1 conserved hypothetical protein [Marinoscillum sp. 108]